MDRTASRPRKTDAILAAALHLLAERGWDTMTIESIAAHAGVNKTTIYRTWATKDELLADALLDGPQLTFEVPDTGSLAGDLVELAQQVNRLLIDPATQRIITAVLAAVPDRPAIAVAARTFFADRLEKEKIIFDRACERGELATPDVDTMLIDLIAGNLWFQTLIRPRTVDTAYIEQLVDLVVVGATAQKK